MASDGNGPSLDFEQLKKIKVFLEASGNSDLLNNAATTTLDYDKVADRNMDAAILVLVIFWGSVAILLTLLGVVGIKTYCTMWEKPRRLGKTIEETIVMTKPS